MCLLAQSIGSHQLGVSMKRVLLLPSVLVALILLLASCGDGANATPAPPPEAQAIRVSYRTSAAAWNTGNVDRFLAGYTDQGVLADWGAPREAAREFLSEFIGSIPVKVVKINSIEVFGDRATVDVVRISEPFETVPVSLWSMREGNGGSTDRRSCRRSSPAGLRPLT